MSISKGNNCHEHAQWHSDKLKLICAKNKYFGFFYFMSFFYALYGLDYKVFRLGHSILSYKNKSHIKMKFSLMLKLVNCKK